MVIRGGCLAAFDSTASCCSSRTRTTARRRRSQPASRGRCCHERRSLGRRRAERRTLVGRTGSREHRPAAARLLHRRATRSAARRRSTRCSSGHPQIFMPALQGAVVLRLGAPRAHAAAPGGTPRTLEEYRALFAGAAPGQRAGEASPHTCGRARRRRDRRGAAGGADHRDPPRARELPALAAPSVHPDLCRDRAGLRKALALEEERRRGRSDPAPHVLARRRCCTPTTSATSSSCAATTTRSRREQVLVLIYDDFRDDNEATVRRVLRFLDVDDTVPIARRRPTPPCGCARSACTSSSTRSGWARPRSRAAKGALKAVDAGAPQAVGPVRRAAASRVRGAAAAGRAADGRAAPALQGRGHALGEYLGRDLVTLWGYDSAG